MTTAVEVRERPILFSGPMVEALLDGRKSQTRRVMKPRDINHRGRLSDLSGVGVFRPQPDGNLGAYLASYPGVSLGEARCPYGQPGDRLWVREAHRIVRINGVRGGAGEFPDVQYREGYAVLGHRPRGTEIRQRQEAMAAAETRWEPSQTGNLWGRWRRSIFMPRWASRITLEITDVRVERLQAISEDDAFAEGIVTGKPYTFGEARECFAALWDKINGKPKPVKGEGGRVTHYVSYPWEGTAGTFTHRGKPWIVTPNPWVWPISFRRLSRGCA